jgi:leucyl/phenylalanyl-tRNA--protein transferase
LRRRVARREFDVRVDTAFAAVIDACARAPRKGQEGTWITADMIRAYVRMHELGYAHSVEAWRGGELVGGLYGLALGGVFFGESMFARVTDASKVCLATLVALLREQRIALIDCQQETEHLASLGARPIPRVEFVRLLSDLVTSSTTPSGFTTGRVEEAV